MRNIGIFLFSAQSFASGFRSAYSVFASKQGHCLHTLGSHAKIVNAANYGNLFTTGPAEFILYNK